MPDYTQIAQSALRSIKEAGMQMSVRRVTSGEIDPVTQISNIATTDYTGYGVLLPVGYSGKERSTLQEQYPAKQKWAKVIMGASGLEIVPTAGDGLVIEESKWEIVNVDTLSPNGTPLIYKMMIAQ